MALGLIGAIGGAGEGLQKQGAYWAEEKKQARIAEMKEQYAIRAEGRAEKRAVAAEGRAQERMMAAEVRAEERALAREGREEERGLMREQRAAAEADRRAEATAKRQREESDYEREAKFQDAKRRQEAGLSTTSTARPRSAFEASDAYERYKANEEERGRTPVDFETFVEQRTGKRPASGMMGEVSEDGTKRTYEVPKDLAEADIKASNFQSLKAYLNQGYTADEARELWVSKGKPEWIIDRMFEELGIE